MLAVDGGNAFLLGGTGSAGLSTIKDCEIANRDGWLIKIDVNGNILWQRCYGGSGNDAIYGIAPADGGGYYLALQSTSGISGNRSVPLKGSIRDYWLIKVDDEGNIIWDKSYGGLGNALIHAILKTSENNYLLVGNNGGLAGNDKSEDGFGGADVWVVLVDENGNKIWDKSWGGDQQDDVFSNSSVCESSTGNFFIAATSLSGASGNKNATGKGGGDFWIIKIDKNGNKIWDKSYGGTSIDRAYSILELNNYYFITGYSESSIGMDKTSPIYGGYDVWLVKIDDNGNIIWDKSYGGNDNDAATAIFYNDDNIVLACVSNSIVSGTKTAIPKGTTDYWIINLDLNGLQKWDAAFGGIEDNVMRRVYCSSQYECYLLGYSTGNAGFDKSENSYGNRDFWLLKTKPDVPLSLPAPRLRAEGSGLRWAASHPLASPTLERAEQDSVLSWKTIANFGADTAGLWHDSGLRPGRAYYYRLRASGRYSPVVRLEALAAAIFSLSPNPARNTATLQYDWTSVSAASAGHIEISDLSGKLIARIPVNAPSGELTLPLDPLAPGCYVLAVRAGGIVWQAGKFVKML